MRGRLLTPRRRWLARAAGLAAGAALAGCATTRSTRPAAAASGTAAPRAPFTPLLYKVSGPGLATGHLFGTMHVGHPDDYPLPAALEAAVDAADALAFEIDTGARWEQLVEAFRPRVWLPDGRTLDALLPPERVAALREFFRIDDGEWQRLRRMQPWWVAQFRFTTGADQALRLTRAQGSERYLVERLRARGRPIVELETVAEQVDSVSGGTLEDQLAQLASLFEAVRATGGLLAPLRDAWRTGDAGRLAALKRDVWGDPEHLPAVWRRAFDERDRRIVERWREAGRDGRRLFVALGVFHLVGPGSVTQRLSEAGMTLRPVFDGQALQSPIRTSEPLA